MSTQPNVYFSNRIEILYQKLKQKLFGQPCSNPFLRRTIVVPSSAIKNWLMLEMAKDPDLTVAAGLEIIGIEKVVDKLVVKKKIPSLLELGLALEVEITKQVSSSRDPLWLPLKKYLNIKSSSSTISRKAEKRLVSLSLKLARLFLHYGTYGLKMVKEWQKQTPNHWQGVLWTKVHENREWSCLANELAEAVFVPETLENREIHLFSISFFSTGHFSFFERLAELIPVFFYQLSPCQAFWSDLCSDRERANLRAYWQKRGITSTQEMQLDEYLRDCNPLLANFGILGREVAKLIEESSLVVETDYSINCRIPHLEEYGALIFDRYHESGGKLSLLSAIQGDLVLLRNPEQSQKIEIDVEDDSLQIHCATSKMREIEALYHTLMHLMQKNLDSQTPFTPADIIVMAPDIMVYEPYIKTVFGSGESQIDFHILDLQIPTQNSLIRGFVRLLDLSASRWDAISLMQLFDEPDFKRTQGFKEEEILEIKEWVTKTGVRWGADAAHRDELLRRDHCHSGMAEKSNAGTWEGSFERLIAGLVMLAGSSPEDSLRLSLQPIQAIESTSAELFGRFIKLIRSIQADLQVLNSGTRLTLKEWVLYLKCLAESYFGVVDKSMNNADEQSLLDVLDGIRRCSFSFKNDVFGFITIRQHLEGAFSGLKTGNRESHLNSVRFCSMLPMRAVPAQIIALVGMSEGEFPRSETKDALDLLATYAGKDFNPSQTDYDRYLFLEVLLSCRQKLILSYVGASNADNQGQSPSLVVTELLSYIRKAFTFGDKTFEEIGFYRHPFHGFDAAYFEKGALLPNYSLSLFKKAQALYAPFKESKHRFFENFKSQEPLKFEEKEITLDIKLLAQFAKNPVKTYFNHALELYIQDNEEDVKKEEDLILSYLEHDKLKKATVKYPLEDVINLADRQGMLPLGPLKKVAINKLKVDTENLHKHLMLLNIKPKELFAMHFLEEVEAPHYNEQGHLELPPLKLNLKENVTVTLVGTLPEVSSQGLVVHGKDDFVDVIKAWPQFLILVTAKKKFGISVENSLLLLKSGEAKKAWFENAEELLVDYLNYFFEGRKTVVPLIPEWTKDFMHLDYAELVDKIDYSLKNIHKPIFNDYVHWIARNEQAFLCESFAQEWPLKAKGIYGNVLDRWFSKRKKDEE